MRRVFVAAAVAAAGVALSAYGFMDVPHLHPPAPSPGPNRAITAQATTRAASPPASDETSAVPVRATAVPPPVSVQPSLVHSAPVPTTPAPSAPKRSAPVRISVPVLEISSDLGPARGLKADGTIDDAPLSGPTWSLPWWYKGGPAPGQPGSAVILGHVNSALGAGHLGVFYKLGDLQPGQQVTVTLADGLATQWLIASNRAYLDGRFPDSIVYNRYGPATLRLVTCGGSFDWQTHEYESAIVVTATPFQATPDQRNQVRFRR